MQVISGDRVDALCEYPALIDVLDDGFRQGAVSPLRHHHQIPRGALAEATLLLMPAWTTASAGDETAAGAYAGVKLVTVTPDNGKRHALPAISGLYLLIATDTGLPLALIDGVQLTVWRTAAASGLASRYLARKDASRMLMVGAGALAPLLIAAHASVRPISHVTIWNRTPDNADALIARLRAERPEITFARADDLDAAVPDADIISTATISETALIKGALLAPGTHLDCVGAFRPTMRETDDDAITRARLWVDTMTGGLNEAGDVVIPLKAGVISQDKIEGDLYGLASGAAPLRSADDEITMFKSVGASIEDLFAAIHVYERFSAEPS
jgi:ornithine cyclodeaminase/alanine dehydrogenase-like protein (mu-crystallin family)